MSKQVYVAGPLFSESDRKYLENMVETLAKATNLNPIRDFFLPHRDGGELEEGQLVTEVPTNRDVFNLDISQIHSASIVVALLDGQDTDSGTCIELGYAYSRGKKIMGLLTDFRAQSISNNETYRPNLMVWGVCEEGKTLFYNLKDLTEAFKQLS